MQPKRAMSISSSFQPVVVPKLHTRKALESRYRIVPTPLDDIPENSPAVYQPEKRSGSSEDRDRSWMHVFRLIHERNSHVFVELSCTDANVAGRDVTRGQIDENVEAYRRAASASVAAGADGVEIHGASGSLLREFLDPRLNQRSDGYGGSVQNRARFILEVVDSVVKAVGAHRVSVHLAPYGPLGSTSATEKTSIITQYSYLAGQLERRAVLGKRLAYIRLEEPRGWSDTCYKRDGDSTSFMYSIWRGAVIQRDSTALHGKRVQNLV